MSFNRIILAASVAFASQFTFAQTSTSAPTDINHAFTNLDAFATNMTSTAVQGTIAVMIGNQYNNFTTTSLIDSSASPAALTKEQISSIVRTANESPLRWLGAGTAGGDRIYLEVTPAQSTTAVSMLAADAEYSKLEVNTRTATDLEGQLTRLGTEKALVKSVTLRGVLARGGTRIVGTLQAFFLVGATANATNAAIFAHRYATEGADTWEVNQCNQVQTATGTQRVCQQPGSWGSAALGAWWNTSTTVFYKFFADQK